MSDLQNWPAWNKNVSGMRVDGPVKAGTSFEWLADHWRIAFRLEEVDPPRRIVRAGASLGIRAAHIRELAEEGQGTRVRAVGSFEGSVPTMLLGITRKTLAASRVTRS